MLGAFLLQVREGAFLTNLVEIFIAKTS